MKYGSIAAMLSTSNYTHNYIPQATDILHLQMVKYWLEQILQSCKKVKYTYQTQTWNP